MANKDNLIEKLRKWKFYYFRCAECALADSAYELGTILGEAADCIERTYSLFEQYKWERDVAIAQLEELGIGFGEKIDGVYLIKEEYEKLLEYKYMYEDLCR